MTTWMIDRRPWRIGRGLPGCRAHLVRDPVAGPRLVGDVNDEGGDKRLRGGVEGDAVEQGGDLVEAERFLGRPYEIEGPVIHGDHRGKPMGFPTANIDLEGVSALKRGVYAADGFIEGGASPLRAAVNLGVRPTFGGEVAWYRTPAGREVGKQPTWLDWPSVRASEMGKPIRSQKELVRLSKFGRRRTAP